MDPLDEGRWSDDTAQGPGLSWALAGQVAGCLRGLLFLAHILPFFVPAFESDCGLPVPWSLIVQGEQLLKAFPRVWRVHPCPLQTLELSHTSTLPPASHASWPLVSALLSTRLRAGFCEALTEKTGRGSCLRQRMGWLWSRSCGPLTLASSFTTSCPFLCLCLK